MHTTQRLRVTGLALGLAASLPVFAQMTPVGTWHTIDDKTQKVKSEIVIADQQGQLSGRITKLLREGADQNARCTECTDDRKDRPLVGLEIIRGAKQAEGKAVWEGGRILTPRTAKPTPCASRPSRAARSSTCVAPSDRLAARKPGCACSKPARSPQPKETPCPVSP